ncbi:MAG: EscU/YscU/HrcU family type III secretion system export apparatus switch protein, partial [Lachnospiraceae bacterium]|nr:EscU/YscU/HrcU family type III secretion system export apparatus switch protein [Lachnospiraceae bacterium]
MVFDIATQISMVYMVVGIIDFIFQRKKFKDDMMMTKQEVKDEYKQSEGDPQVKGQIRRKMREVSQRRMMQKLPEADVVITNPTHYAVAIKYDLAIAKAPVVIAKGEDYLALKIKEAARQHDIEIVENKPLARALYQSVEIDEEIPQELYQAVAEVLAVVYNTKKKAIPVGK